MRTSVVQGDTGTYIFTLPLRSCVTSVKSPHLSELGESGGQ